MRSVFSLTDAPSSYFFFPCKCNQMPFYMWTYLYWPNVFFLILSLFFFVFLLSFALLSFYLLPYFFLPDFFSFVSFFFFFLVVVVTHAILRLLH